MDEGYLSWADSYKTEYRRKRRWQIIVTVLCLVAALCTAYALSTPAITMEDAVCCGLAEHAVHGASCFDADGNLICEQELHTHSLQCFSDPTADTETAEIWEQTVNAVEHTGHKAADASAVAMTQLGYKESESNYEVYNDTLLRGYTRYGEWYGDPYMDWDSVFCAFCYSYAGVTKAEMPMAPDSESLLRAVKARSQFEESGYVPKAGDLLFVKLDGGRLHVGMAADVTYDADGAPVGITSIDGDFDNAVTQNTWAIGDERIVGYAVLKDAAAEPMKAAVLGAGNETGITSASSLNNSGSYRLNSNISITQTIVVGSGKNVSINLNGKKITGTADPLFRIENGGKLTITDSTMTYTNGLPNDRLDAATTAKEYGKTASYANGTLTYYITKTTVTDPGTGATSEVTETHTATGGMIVGNNDGKRAFVISGGNGNTASQLNLNGGYICNFGDLDEGSVARAESYWGAAEINIDGAVIAANTANNRGGAFCLNGSYAALNLESGAIAGNMAYYEGGGGICAMNEAKINMRGGYITNNYATSADYFRGGGGVLLQSKAELNLIDGYITSNKAAGGGGGIKTWQDWGGNSTGKVKMYGGFVTANNAVAAEGGGMNINAGGSLYIEAGYITNNILSGGKNTEGFSDWGGGGIFCAEDSASSVILNSLFTNNSAGGFGGGVAGCATGRIVSANENGTAIFDNEALGLHVSGDASTKNSDHQFAAENDTFMSHGYQDYFCALASDITNGMLGGGLEQWEGSSDGVAVSANSEGDTILGGYMTGLSSHASEEDKALAKNAARTFFNGNESPTHGGGILVNGYLLLGSVDNNSIDLFCRLELGGIRKQFVDENGLPLAQEEGQFNVTVVDEDGVEVSHGSNTADGEILFDRMLSFTDTGGSSSKTFTYYLYELPAEDSSIQNDTSKYKIEVTVRRTANAGTVPWTDPAVSITKYQFTNLKITDMSSGSVITNADPGNNDSHPISVDATGGKAFTNRKVTGGTPESPSTTTPKAYVSVSKIYSDSPRNKPEVTVDLLKNGSVVDTRKLNSSNNFRYTWNKVGGVDLDPTASYTVQERAVSGYVPSYEYKYSYDTTTVVDESQRNAALLYVKSGSYFVKATSTEKPSSSDTPGNKVYLIASPDGAKILKTTAGHANAGFTAADTYAITRDDANDRYLAADVPADCQFRVIKHTKDGYTYYCFANQGVNSFLLVQDADGNFLKGTDSTDWASYIRIDSSGELQGQREWANNEWRYIIWDGAKFTTAEAISCVSYEIMSASHKDYTITNTPTASLTYKLNIVKTDSSTNSVLPGATFRLLNGNTPLKFIRATSGRYTYTSSNTGSTTDLVTGTDGHIRLSGLPPGTFTLRETSPPYGYDIAPDKTVTLGTDTPDATLNVTVEDGSITYVLPETGGIGVSEIYLLGALLTAFSLISFVRLYRKQR